MQASEMFLLIYDIGRFSFLNSKNPRNVGFYRAAFSVNGRCAEYGFNRICVFAECSIKSLLNRKFGRIAFYQTLQNYKSLCDPAPLRPISMKNGWKKEVDHLDFYSVTLVRSFLTKAYSVECLTFEANIWPYTDFRTTCPLYNTEHRTNIQPTLPNRLGVSSYDRAVPR